MRYCARRHFHSTYMHLLFSLSHYFIIIARDVSKVSLIVYIPAMQNMPSSLRYPLPPASHSHTLDDTFTALVYRASQPIT